MSPAAPLRALGAWTLRSERSLARFAVFSGAVLDAARRRPLRLRRLVGELYDAGVLSLLIVCVSGFAVGMVLGLQGYTQLSRFGAEGNVGAFVGLSLIRELGPVLTSLLVAGRAGSAVAAEIAAMTVTEQLDGLRMMSVDPLSFVVAPKAFGILLAMPLLSTLFVVFGILGGWMIAVVSLGGDPGAYLATLEDSVEFSNDVVGGLIKGAVFGVLVGFVATYRGYTATPTTAGVSAAATSTVVIASVATLIFDYFITALWGF